MKVENNHGKVMAALERRAAQVMRVRAESMRSEIYGVLEASRVGSGRVYKRKGKTHQASAPGEPPAREYGKLMESVKAKQVTPLRWTVGPDPSVFKDEFYPAFLEFGTIHIAPRPFMRPAIERYKRAWSGQGRVSI